MHVVHKAINFNIDDVLSEELPFMNNFYRSKGELREAVKDLLSFPTQNKEAMPFYTIKDSSTRLLNKQFEQFYAMMLDALQIAFDDEEMLYKYFDCSFLREHGKRFVPYAKATWDADHPAIYGRFDACFDPETEALLGVYEFNGDTPVMLFESVNLQARFSAELGTDQYNNWWDVAMAKFGRMYGGKWAVACGTDYVEDMATCETVAQAFKESASSHKVSFLDLKELDFDHLNISKPFVGRGTEDYYDVIYVLSPWEEMIANFPDMLNNWDRWIDNVQLVEPAWRWFMSNKGMMTLCTHLMKESLWFYERYSYLPLIPTYLTRQELYAEYYREKCVEKPVVGRLSNNIKVWNHNGELITDTGGYYSEENTVCQVYCAPRKVEGRNNFILGMWMMGESSASMCAREFDTEVLSISNERFIPHIVVEG